MNSITLNLTTLVWVAAAQAPALAAVSNMPAAQRQEAAGGFGEPKAVARALRPSVASALDRVHAFERACFDHRLFKYDGTINDSPHIGLEDDGLEALQAFLLEGEHPDAGGYPGALVFNVGSGGVGLAELIECARYDAGYRGAALAARSDQDLTPDDIESLLDADFVFAEPVEGSEAAVRLAELGRAQQRFAPLGNGSIAYVAWGLLFVDEFWSRTDTARALAAGSSRAAFIHGLVTRGALSDHGAAVSLRVLQPPLLVTDEFTGRGAAFGRVHECAWLGFSEADQRLVANVRDALMRGETPMVGDSLTEAVDEVLDRWAAEMLSRVLRDRGTTLEADDRMRNGSLAERLQYWRDFAKRASFEEFRRAYLDEITRIAGLVEGLPGHARVEELRAQLQVRDLTQAETAELAALGETHRSQRRQLIGQLGSLLIDSGGRLHFAAVAQTLAGPTESLLFGFFDVGDGGVIGGAIGGERRALLGPVWTKLAQVQSGQMAWVLDDHLSGVQRLPDYGIDTMLLSATAQADTAAGAGPKAVLRQFLAQGSPVEKASVLANSRWLGDTEFEAAFTAVKRAEQVGAASSLDRGRLSWSLLGAVMSREGRVGHRLLLESFEDGRWCDPSSHGSWLALPHGPMTTQLFARLSAAERNDLVERGLAPAALFGD